MKRPGEVVYLVDDDVSVREAITGLLESVQIEVLNFESAESFLRHERSDTAGCLVLDLQLPEMSGLELQERLRHSSNPPIIFITGRGDIPSSVRAMKAGAVEFLTKPIDSETLIAAIRNALSRDRGDRMRQAELAELGRRYSRLTPREREVLPLVAAGFMNKQSAAMLGITDITLQNHRGQVMRKMEATSLADLVRMCGALGIPNTIRKPAKHGTGARGTKESSGDRGNGEE